MNIIRKKAFIAFLVFAGFSSGKSFASGCETVALLKTAQTEQERKEKRQEWIDAVRDVLTDDAELGSTMTEEAVKKSVDKNKIPIASAINELDSFCKDVISENDEAIRYFKAWSFFSKKLGPFGKFFATEIDIGVKILEAWKAIGSNYTFQTFSDMQGVATITIKLKGEDCGRMYFDCDWSSNDIPKIVQDVSVMVSRGGTSQPVSGGLKCELISGINCPTEYRQYTFETDGDRVTSIRLTFFDGQKMFIPYNSKYVKGEFFGGGIINNITIPLFVNNKRYVKYNY